MSTATVFFILYALTGEASLTPIGQYQSEEACVVAESAMNAILGGASVDNAKFKCISGESIIEMMKQNGVDIS